eukprot:COSAG05_NODE_11581_length_506_cov_1.122850_1_plen_46_part_01
MGDATIHTLLAHQVENTPVDKRPHHRGASTWWYAVNEADDADVHAM